ncbi:MAG: ATP-binding protein [Odoribacter sp.]
MSIIALIIALIIIYWLIHRLRTTNRKLSYFFDALGNDDYTLRFTETQGLPSEKMLNHSLNRIKTLIQNTRLEIQQKEKYYELILSSIYTGVIALNTKGFVTQCNRFALKLLGLEIFTHVNQLCKVSSQLHQVFLEIKPGESRRVTFTNERGTVQLLIGATQITIQDEKLTLLVINDIENEMDEKEIDSWIRLIRVLSHEIMNSIAPITSLSDTLSNMHKTSSAFSEEEQEQVKQNTINGLQVISETGKGLISFVESYRKFTRIPEPVKESIDLNEFIHRMVILCSMEPNFSKITINIQIHPIDLKIYADPNLLGQVVLNLMKNAIQAMQEQTEGTLSILAEADPVTKIIRIKITDNGPGIPPEIINEVFVPFFTTRAEGSGIGLSIARQIMRAHGGNIKVSSIPHQETTFTLSL